MDISISLFILLSLISGIVHSENILFLLPISSKSHKNVYDPLISALALNGHNITVVSSVKPSKNIPLVHEITPTTSEEVFAKYVNPFEARKLSTLKRLFYGADHWIDICHQVYKNEEIQHLLQHGQFDLTIVNGIGNNCFYGMLYQFKCPTMALLTLPAANFITERLGTHLPPSHVPLSFLDLTEKMTFTQRLTNSLVQWMIKLAEKLYYSRIYREFKNQYHGESSPEIAQIASNISMLLVNSHISMNPSMPLLPDIVEIGGMHCKPAKPVKPDSLRQWLDEAKDGFVYFSFGSIIQGNMMPENYRKLFINVFSRLPVRVLWKWETEIMEDLPSNVKLMKWIPQQDVLGHTNIRLFITHGGLLSTQEAVYHAVPLIGIPFFADQDLNTAQGARRGFAKKLEILDLTEEILENAIVEMLSNNQYKKKAQELSNIFRDQPQTPLERAVYWVEYVMRHHGAPELRSAARDLNMFQYHSLDIVAFIAFLLFMVIWVSKCILCFIIRKTCWKRKTTNLKKKRE